MFLPGEIFSQSHFAGQLLGISLIAAGSFCAILSTILAILLHDEIAGIFVLFSIFSSFCAAIGTILIVTL